MRGVERRQRRDRRFDGGAADAVVVGLLLAALEVVDDEIDGALPDHVEHVRRAFADLVHALGGDPVRFEQLVRARRRDERVAERDEPAHQIDGVVLLLVADRHEHAAAFARQPNPRADEALAQRAGERRVDAEHFAGRLHLRPEDRLDAAHLREREHRHFDHDVVGLRAQARCPSACRAASRPARCASPPRRD